MSDHNHKTSTGEHHHHHHHHNDATSKYRQHMAQSAKFRKKLPKILWRVACVVTLIVVAVAVAIAYLDR